MLEDNQRFLWVETDECSNSFDTLQDLFTSGKTLLELFLMFRFLTLLKNFNQDMKYFGGSLEDLLTARGSCELPLLRKEFIIDPYQIIEAKAYGADVILLIAAVLSRKEIENYSVLAQKLGMEVLLEVHNENELHKSIMPSLNMIGVNNRNLKTFEVNLETSKTLSKLIPNEFVKISESGISEVEDIKSLQPYGYKGFLIGENFMKTKCPGASAAAFIKQLNG